MRGTQINLLKSIVALLLCVGGIIITGRILFSEGGPFDTNSHNEATSHYENIVSDNSAPDSSAPDSSVSEIPTSNNSLNSLLLQLGLALLFLFAAIFVRVLPSTDREEWETLIWSIEALERAGKDIKKRMGKIMITIHSFAADSQVFGLVRGNRWGWLPLCKEGDDFHVGDFIKLVEKRDGWFTQRSIFLKIEKIFDDPQVCKDGTVIIVFKRIYFTLFLRREFPWKK